MEARMEVVIDRGIQGERGKDGVDREFKNCSSSELYPSRSFFLQLLIMYQMVGYQ